MRWFAIPKIAFLKYETTYSPLVGKAILVGAGLCFPLLWPHSLLPVHTCQISIMSPTLLCQIWIPAAAGCVVQTTWPLVPQTVPVLHHLCNKEALPDIQTGGSQCGAPFCWQKYLCWNTTCKYFRHVCFYRFTNLLCMSDDRWILFLFSGRR